MMGRRHWWWVVGAALLAVAPFVNLADAAERHLSRPPRTRRCK